MNNETYLDPDYPTNGQELDPDFDELPEDDDPTEVLTGDWAYEGLPPYMTEPEISYPCDYEDI